MDHMNKLICIDCVEGMKQLPSDSIPLTVTSPPWDSLRTFDGHSEFDFPATAEQLWRVTARGGVVCWHVADQIVDGSETGTSAVQKLRFIDVGFCLHQTLVIDTNGFHRSSRYRYGWPPQYVFVLSKGMPRHFSPIKDVVNKHAGTPKLWSIREPDGKVIRQKQVVIKPHRVRGPVWCYNAGLNNSTSDREAFQHPALMPEKLARDLIVSWSRAGDLVFDPFSGAGTTLKMAMLNHRHFLGFEVNRDFVSLGRQRLSKHRKTLVA